MNHDPQMIRKFEEVSNNAWPALQTFYHDGWILRFANGVTKRSNSVNLLYPSTKDPETKIRFCEGLYRSRNIPVVFKITEIADPRDIDDFLARLGYIIHSTISFQTLFLTGLDLPPYDEAHILAQTEGSWTDDFIRMNGFEPGRQPTYNAIMDQIMTPKCLISMKDGKKTIGVGLGVLEGRNLGLFDIVIDPVYRNKGMGFRLVCDILSWGKRQGAETAYLQVLSDNAPAIRLYEKIGFTELYRYWYRMQKA